MNEADWLTTTNTQEMFWHLLTIPGVSNRKLRLFACGCCRQAWHLLVDERSRHAVEIAEKRADGVVSPEALAAAFRANDAVCCVPRPVREGWAANAVGHAVSGEDASSLDATGDAEGFEPLYEAEAAADGVTLALALTGNLSATRAVNSDLLRDIFGPWPFRPLPSLASTLLLVRLANAVYDNRQLPSGEFDRDRLAILCDAIEESGCIDASILEHLRGPGPHWRGCWCVDLLLGKG
jgi:hypothetical protein